MEFGNKIELMDIDSFIEKYKDQINYCEALILPDGQITWAVPSHQMALASLSSRSFEELSNDIPLNASPTHYLSEMMNVVLVRNNDLLFPLDYTHEQITIVAKLMNRNLVKKSCLIEVSSEYSYFKSEDKEYLHNLSSNKKRVRMRILNDLRKIFLDRDGNFITGNGQRRDDPFKYYGMA